MQSEWASQNLQVIRTLMERSALYRRALAPVMIAAGTLGLLAAVIPCFLHIESNATFTAFWMSVAIVAFLVTLLLVRRQALQDAEAFWSPPTRRVFQALLPSFVAGLLAGVLFLCPEMAPRGTAYWLPPAWMIFYGCGLHAAGFFMPRGMKICGWSFVVAGFALVFATFTMPALRTTEAAHYVMGVFFGVFHLLYGGYLYLTEPRKNAA